MHRFLIPMLLLAAGPAAAQSTLYLQEPDGSVLVAPPDGWSYTIQPLPGGGGYLRLDPDGSASIHAEPAPGSSPFGPGEPCCLSSPGRPRQ